LSRLGLFEFYKINEAPHLMYVAEWADSLSFIH